MTTVLVAEDNPVNCELLRELLEARGYNVIEAQDGQEALRMIEQDPGKSRLTRTAGSGGYRLCHAR
jgi:CheY-like chemotaxis protein